MSDFKTRTHKAWCDMYPLGAEATFEVYDPYTNTYSLEKRTIGEDAFVLQVNKRGYIEDVIYNLETAINFQDEDSIMVAIAANPDIDYDEALDNQRKLNYNAELMNDNRGIANGSEGSVPTVPID